MKTATRIALTIGLFLGIGLAVAAPDVSPWKTNESQNWFRWPQRFDQEVRAAYIDAGTVTVSTLNVATINVSGGSGVFSMAVIDAGALVVGGNAVVGGMVKANVIDAGALSVAGRIDSATDGFHGFHDHSGASGWDEGVASVSTEGNNADNWTVRRQGGSNPYIRVDKSTGQTISSFGFAVSSPGASGTDERVVPVAAPSDGGTPSVYIEYGQATASSGRVSVTFKNAFTSAPTCTATQYLDGGVNLEQQPTTTTANFHTAGASSVFNFICIGQR